MDSFTYMLQSLGKGNIKVKAELKPKAEAKRGVLRKASETKKYEVVMIPKVYGIRMSALSYKVIELLLEGKTPQQVAEELGLNQNAVNLHKTSVARKIGISNSEVLPYIRQWKKDNPSVPLPRLDLVNSFSVAGVTLSIRKYRLLKELIDKDVDQVAREMKISKTLVWSHRYQISEAFNLPWEEVRNKVKEYWQDNPPEKDV